MRATARRAPRMISLELSVARVASQLETQRLFFFFWVFEEDSVFFNLGVIGAWGGERRAVLGRHKRGRREARASPQPCAMRAERHRVDGSAAETAWGSPRRSQAWGRAVILRRPVIPRPPQRFLALPIVLFLVLLGDGHGDRVSVELHWNL